MSGPVTLCSNGDGRAATHRHNAWYSYCSKCSCPSCVLINPQPKEESK